MHPVLSWRVARTISILMMTSMTRKVEANSATRVVSPKMIAKMLTVQIMRMMMKRWFHPKKDLGQNPE